MGVLPGCVRALGKARVQHAVQLGSRRLGALGGGPGVRNGDERCTKTRKLSLFSVLCQGQSFLKQCTATKLVCRRWRTNDQH